MQERNMNPKAIGKASDLKNHCLALRGFVMPSVTAFFHSGESGPFSPQLASPCVGMFHQQLSDNFRGPPACTWSKASQSALSHRLVCTPQHRSLSAPDGTEGVRKRDRKRKGSVGETPERGREESRESRELEMNREKEM